MRDVLIPDLLKLFAFALLALFAVQALLSAVPAAGLTLVLGLVVLAVWAVLFEPRKLIVKHYALKASSTVKPIKIVMLGCIHAGSPFIGIEKLHKIVELINEQEPDLIFLLGDFVATFVLFGSPLNPESVAQELKALKARHGKLAVLGNHDLWHGKERITKALESAEIKVLENTCVRIMPDSADEFIVAGIEFHGNQQEAVKDTFSTAPIDKPTIALIHSPDTFPHLPPHVMLTCASHTHGGQIRLPLLGALLVPCKTGTRYASGLYHEHGRKLIVTSGIGTSILPARLFCPPEIVALTLNTGH
ncbi:MAG TPA: metallophosphoesterase [Candidatus Obscuribacterales bacterium]